MEGLIKFCLTVLFLIVLIVFFVTVGSALFGAVDNLTVVVQSLQ